MDHLTRVRLVEDRELLDGYRRGAREALGAVFEEYGPRVAKWIAGGFDYLSGGQRVRFRGFAAPYDQHDVMSEVFRIAFEERTRLAYSGLKAFEGYLFAITKNTILKRLGGRDRAISDDDRVAAQPSDDPSPEENVAQKEERAIVRRFLADLTDEDRRFVELRFVEQHSQNAVAEALEWSRKKVRLREGAIRTKLTRFLKRSRGSAELVEAMDDSR